MTAEAATEACTAATRAESVLVRAAVFFRVGGLLQIAVVVMFTTGRYPHLGWTVALIAGVIVESAILTAACIRADRLPPAWITADALVCGAGLWAGSALTAPTDGHTWVHFMYPFTLITSIGIGLSYRRLRTVNCMTLLVAGSYALSAHVLHRDPLWNVAPNSASYFANTVVAWLVARQLRSSGRDADRNRAEAVARADELAQERERARHARLLHDRILQTLETLARGDWLPDATVRGHLSAEASWLRALVEGTPLDRPDDLLTALQTVVQLWARTGLRVDFNSTQLHDAVDWRKKLRAPLVEALADATGEALANVAKHAGVDSATVGVTVTDGELIVSILDHGRGFDQTTARRGIGLDQSITMRMNSVGCQAQVNSAPGSGTYVELSVPRAACDNTAV